VMLAEAETLRALFPAEYDLYSQSVPLFVPRLTPYGATGDRKPARTVGRFAVSQYMKHREYRAAFGLAAVYALLAAKFLFIG